MKDIKEVVRKNLIRCREEKGITQEELGIILGKSKTAVASWEQGRSNPDIEMLYRLAIYYNKSIQSMYEDN